MHRNLAAIIKTYICFDDRGALAGIALVREDLNTTHVELEYSVGVALQERRVKSRYEATLLLVTCSPPVFTQYNTSGKFAIEARQKNAVNKGTQRCLIGGKLLFATIQPLVQQIYGVHNDLAGPGRGLSIRQSQRERRNKSQYRKSKHSHPHLKLLSVLAITARRTIDQELAYYILKQEGRLREQDLTTVLEIKR